MIFCRNCGRAMNENQAICLGCGVKKGTGISFCEYCGSGVSSAAAVCLRCGAAIKKGSSGGSIGNDLAGNSKASMLVICWFLGMLGVHNFMMGETKKGLVKIIGLFVTFGLGSLVLMLIDFIKICSNSYEADPEKFF